MEILHTATAWDGRQYVVVEYAVRRACHWYDARRLVLAETDGTSYHRANGRNVVRVLKDITYDDVRSRSARWEYLGTVGRLTREADEFAQRGDVPPGTAEITLDDLRALGVAGGAA